MKSAFALIPVIFLPTVAYGDCNLSKISEIDRMFTDFDNIIGLDRFTLLHPNDSETKLQEKVNRHACVGKGYIWGEDF